MLPVAKKPIVQYVVEELCASGVDRLLFVTGRGKDSIENHFDHNPELAETLRNTNKSDQLEELAFESLDVTYLYTRQAVQRGLGDAILHGEPFVGAEPFVVALGDSIIGRHGSSRICRRLCEVFEEQRAAAVIAVEAVEPSQVTHYGVVDPESDGDVFAIKDLVEKPSPELAPSNLAIVGRYAFSPIIFERIRGVGPDAHSGEIGVTEAIRTLCQTGEKVIGVKLPPGERRYDIGNFGSYFETFVEFALDDPRHGPRLREKLKGLLDEA